MPAPEPPGLAGDELAGWSLPALREPYGAALAQAAAFVREHLNPVGVVAAGSVIRGEARRSSDLDLQVISRSIEQRQVNRRFNGVPTEIFVHSVERMRQHFGAEPRGGWLANTHMLATGVTLYEADPVVAELRAQAAAVLRRRPEPPASLLTRLRYHATSALEDGLDIAGEDPAQAAALLSRAVEGAIQYRFWTALHWQPPHKDILRELAAVDEDLAAQVRSFYLNASVPEQADLARDIVRRSIGLDGFFEWDSAVQ